MFNKLSIKNFRGIEKLDIENFNRINIFVGENGIGKTSILDAIYVSINPNNALLSFKTNLFRRIDDAVNNPNFWRTFFYKFSEKNKISISLSNKSKDNKRKIEIKPVYSAQKLTLQPQENKQNDFFSTSPTIEEETILGLNYECTIGDKKITSDITQKDSNSFQSKADENYQENLNGSYLNNHTFLDNDNIASKLSNLIDRKRKNELLDLLKKFKLSISDIVLDKNRKIKIDDNGFSELVYAHTYGDGFVRALHIICNFMANDSDVVLIDELENGLIILEAKRDVPQKIIDKLNDFKVKIPREEFRCNLDEQDFVVNRWLRFLEGEFGPINAPNTYFKKENGTILKNLDFDSCQKNIAASAQKLLELKMIDLVRFALKKTNCKNICLSGGVALNCIANKEILKNNDIDNLFIQPASNDAGVSMGAALESFCRKGGKLNFKLNRSDFGPEFTNLEIKKELDLMNLSYKKVSNISKECAELIKDGKIIGWFQGRMEWGPRALGNRSIIANPTSMAMANKVNLNVKNRELWRPFAPSLLSEFSKDYLKIESDYDFMVLGSEIYPEMKKRIKGVVHLDGSIRPHVVKKSVNPKYHKLITEFYNLTGIPLVLNTSFNVRGEPIVCTPKEAVKTFLSTGLDCLAMGDYLIKK